MVEKPAVGGEGIPHRLCLAGYIFCCKIEAKTENQWFPEAPYFITANNAENRWKFRTA